MPPALLQDSRYTVGASVFDAAMGTGGTAGVHAKLSLAKRFVDLSRQELDVFVDVVDLVAMTLHRATGRYPLCMRAGKMSRHRSHLRLHRPFPVHHAHAKEQRADVFAKPRHQSRGCCRIITMIAQGMG